LKLPVKRIVFANGHYGAKEQSGATNATNIQADDRTTLAYDTESRWVHVEELLRDQSIRSYVVPSTSLCQIYFQPAPAAEKKAAPK
jgi:hypothetical protein